MMNMCVCVADRERDSRKPSYATAKAWKGFVIYSPIEIFCNTDQGSPYFIIFTMKCFPLFHLPRLGPKCIDQHPRTKTVLSWQGSQFHPTTSNHLHWIGLCLHKTGISETNKKETLPLFQIKPGKWKSAWNALIPLPGAESRVFLQNGCKAEDVPLKWKHKRDNWCHLK